MHIVPMFLRKPPFLAETDFSGTVVAVGSEIASSSSSESCDQESCFAIGNQVFGSIPVAAHLKGVGALAEYAAVEAKFVAIKPDNVTMADASCLLVSAITAIDIVDLADLKPGYRVLINAPCGGIGNFAIQVIRRATGSEGHIVGICSSANNELAKKLGCDRTESYGLDQESLVRHLSSTCEKEGLFDMIIDCHGSQKLWLSAEKLLKSGSGHHYVTVGPRFPSMTYSGMLTIIWQMITNLFTPVWLGGVNRSYKQAASFINQEKLQRVRKLAEDGVIKPHVGGVFKFEDAKEVSLYKSVLFRLR